MMYAKWYIETSLVSLSLRNFAEDTLLFQSSITKLDNSPAGLLQNRQHYSDLLGFLVEIILVDAQSVYPEEMDSVSLSQMSESICQMLGDGKLDSTADENVVEDRPAPCIRQSIEGDDIR